MMNENEIKALFGRKKTRRTPEMSMMGMKIPKMSLNMSMPKLNIPKINFRSAGLSKLNISKPRLNIPSLSVSRPNYGQTMPTMRKVMGRKKVSTRRTPYMVFNKTDRISAAPFEFDTREEAEQYAEDFPKRFEHQGFYKTFRGDKIDPEDVELEIIETEDEDEELPERSHRKKLGMRSARSRSQGVPIRMPDGSIVKRKIKGEQMGNFSMNIVRLDKKDYLLGSGGEYLQGYEDVYDFKELRPLNKEAPKKNELNLHSMGEDFWGRKTYVDPRTKREYKDVDGTIMPATKDGEPIGPLRKDIKVNIDKKIKELNEANEQAEIDYEIEKRAKEYEEAADEKERVDNEMNDDDDEYYDGPIEEYREKSAWEEEQDRVTEEAEENERYRKEYGNEVDDEGN